LVQLPSQTSPPGQPSKAAGGSQTSPGSEALLPHRSGSTHPLQVSLQVKEGAQPLFVNGGSHTSPPSIVESPHTLAPTDAAHRITTQTIVTIRFMSPSLAFRGSHGAIDARYRGRWG